MLGRHSGASSPDVFVERQQQPTIQTTGDQNHETRKSRVSVLLIGEETYEIHVTDVRG
jgi:hypothetical protein